MKRRSQTELAVLGALSVEPMSGYAVRESIRDVLGHFWTESYGQIYPKLAELLEAGLVEKQASGRKGASVYSITPEGEVRLRRLLREPIQPSPARNGLLLRLFFGRHLGPDACRELLAEARVQAEARIEELTRIRAEVEAEDATDDHPYWMLTISAGEHGARTTLEWIDESLAALEALAKDR